MKETKFVKFDGFAIPEPVGEWEYNLDDYGVVYGPGIWPFYSKVSDVFKKNFGQNEPRSIRLAPDHDYSAARNLYVMMWPISELAQADISVYVKPQGLGGYVGNAAVHFNLKENNFTVKLCPTIIREQVEEKATKILRFLAVCRQERDTGRLAPKNAHEKWEEKNRKEKL